MKNIYILFYWKLSPHFLSSLTFFSLSLLCTFPLFLSLYQRIGGTRHRFHWLRFESVARVWINGCGFSGKVWVFGAEAWITACFFSGDKALSVARFCLQLLGWFESVVVDCFWWVFSMVGVNFRGCGLMLVVVGDGYLAVICLMGSDLARFRFGCWRCWVCCGGVAATSWWVWVHLIWVFFLLLLFLFIYLF